LFKKKNGFIAAENTSGYSFKLSSRISYNTDILTSILVP